MMIQWQGRTYRCDTEIELMTFVWAANAGVTAEEWWLRQFEVGFGK